MKQINNPLIGILSISLLTTSPTGNVYSIKENNAVQFLGQLSFSIQTAACESENDTALSCNNVALEFKGNEGNNAAGQE